MLLPKPGLVFLSAVLVFKLRIRSRPGLPSITTLAPVSWVAKPSRFNLRNLNLNKAYHFYTSTDTILGSTSGTIT